MQCIAASLRYARSFSGSASACSVLFITVADCTMQASSSEAASRRTVNTLSDIWAYVSCRTTDRFPSWLALRTRADGQCNVNDWAVLSCRTSPEFQMQWLAAHIKGKKSIYCDMGICLMDAGQAAEFPEAMAGIRRTGRKSAPSGIVIVPCRTSLQFQVLAAPMVAKS